MRQIIHRRSAINLKEELKGLMFPISGPVCISEDEELFKNTMIMFYQHEQSVSGEGGREGERRGGREGGRERGGEGRVGLT